MNQLYIYMPPLILVVIILLVYFRAKKPGRKGISRNTDNVVIEIRVPKNESDSHDKDVLSVSLAAENMFASLHGLLRSDASLQEYFSFEIVSNDTGIKFYTVIPQSIQKFVESQIYAQYPTASLVVAKDYTSIDTSKTEYSGAYITLQKDEFIPIKTFKDFESEPLSGLTSSMSEIQMGEQIWFQISVKPTADVWQKAGYDYVNGLRAGTLKKSSGGSLAGRMAKGLTNELVIFAYTFATQLFRGPSTTDQYGRYQQKPQTPLIPKLSPVQELELKSIETKLSKMGYLTQVRVVSMGDSVDRVNANLRGVVATLKQFATSTSNSFTAVSARNKEEVLEDYKARTLDESKSFILNIEELATLYHLPSSNVETPNMSWVFSKKSEPPAGLPLKDCCYIGDTIYRNSKMRFGIKNGDDRLRHMYLIGKSGTGKSTLFENMISQDIANGFGVGVLDPHGELIDKVLDYIPENRIDDVIIFDPSDVERPTGINLLEMADPSQKNLMASALVSAIRHQFDYSWGPRLEYLLNYCILTLLEVPGTSMLGITRLMEDDNYRKYILHFVKDPVVVKFWETEFRDMKGNQKLVTEAIAPIQNKVNRFLASTTIRNILGQRHSTIDLWDAMNSGKIILMNLSKGKIGADNANLLGALLVSRIQFMALQRAKLQRNERRPFYLYVDEFQNFATGSFEEILSESRKYGLGLYLTHQFTAQLPEELLKAVYGNVGTIATFSLGAPDAKALASEFAPYFDEEDIISLERFHIYLKLMIDGMTSLPFSARIVVPWAEENPVVPKHAENREIVIQRSRERYGVPRELIEEKINRWVEAKFDKGMAIAFELKDRKAQEPQPNQPQASQATQAQVR